MILQILSLRASLEPVKCDQKWFLLVETIFKGFVCAFELCYVIDIEILLHHYFYARVDIVDVIRGPLIGEHIA